MTDFIASPMFARWFLRHPPQRSLLLCSPFLRGGTLERVLEMRRSYEQETVSGDGIPQLFWGCETEFAGALGKVGISGERAKLLDYVVEDCRKKGISPLYLVTDHIGFYERYGWEFLCMVQGEGEPEMTRMYRHP